MLSLALISIIPFMHVWKDSQGSLPVRLIKVAYTSLTKNKVHYMVYPLDRMIYIEDYESMF